MSNIDCADKDDTKCQHSHLKAFQDSLQYHRGWQLGSTCLEQKYVSVDHCSTEVALDVGHCLALDLQPVANPQATHDLVEGCLKNEKKIMLSINTY